MQTNEKIHAESLERDCELGFILNGWLKKFCTFYTRLEHVECNHYVYHFFGGTIHVTRTYFHDINVLEFNAEIGFVLMSALHKNKERRERQRVVIDRTTLDDSQKSVDRFCVRCSLFYFSGHTNTCPACNEHTTTINQAKSKEYIGVYE